MSNARQRRFLFAALVVASGFGVVKLVGPTSAPAIPSDPEEISGPRCDSRVEFAAYLRVVGLPLTGREVSIDASSATISVLLPTCELEFAGVPRFSWQLTARPAGSTAALNGSGMLTPSLRLDRTGTYQVRLTACPGGCLVRRERGGVIRFPGGTRDVEIIAQDKIALPPETEPKLPAQALTPASQTIQSAPTRDSKCQEGGGLEDPSWVTVYPWDGPDDYQSVEGVVLKSHVSTSDNYANHDSQDYNAIVEPDPAERSRILRFDSEHTEINHIEIEWERNSFPEGYWPIPGDRVSVFGYWILDCGHAPFKAEIHPPVGFAVHRVRPVTISRGWHPTRFPTGFGSNVTVPGIVTDLWFNRNGGETTRVCNNKTLHQPSPTGYTDGDCILGPSPLNRVFRFNIYLPRDPRAILLAAHHKVPPVPLYVAFEGAGGPNPTYVVRHNRDTAWLEVSVDLRSLTASTYSRRITAAWAYPSPENWDLRRWRLILKSMEVLDDGDFDSAGDWRFWVNTNNTGQEWTKLIDCDNCVHSDRPFHDRDHTGAALGPDILTFPFQSIWVSTSGYEDDNWTDDDTGTVAKLYDEKTAPGDHADTSQCVSEEIGYAGPVKLTTEGCAKYRLHYNIARQPVALPQLTQPARLLYEKYLIRAESPPACRKIITTCVLLPAAQATPTWYIQTPQPGSGSGDAVARPAKLALYEPRDPEELEITDMTAAAVRKNVLALKRTQPATLRRVLQGLRSELTAMRRAHGRADDLAFVLKWLHSALPPDLYKSVVP
jgi:hypothetical protein